jgi:type I site-specific restriction-modification system R (restriction) subunit
MNKFIFDLEASGWKKFQLERRNLSEFIDRGKLLIKLKEINPRIPTDFIQRFINTLSEYSAPSLLQENKEIFEKFLVAGFDFGGYRVKFLSEEYSKNTFTYCENFSLQSHVEDRIFQFDLLLFVNYLPLIIVVRGENKQKCYERLANISVNLRSVYKYNFFNLFQTRNNYYIGTISDETTNYFPWKPTVKELLRPAALLNIFHHYTTFRTQDRKKILARYYQYYCGEKIIKTIEQQKFESKKGGVVWHATGSGKSLTMIFSAKRIFEKYPRSTLLIITDRRQLNQQIKGFFSEFPFLLSRDRLISVESIDYLVKILQKPNFGKIIFTTLHKFQGKNEREWKTFFNPHGMFVFVDEAHRSQNFRVEEDRFSYARIVRSIMPQAYFLAWTGTPITNKDKSTYAEFGSLTEPIHSYSTQQASHDQVIIDEIFYDYFPLADSELTRQQQIVQKIKQDYEEMAKKFMNPKLLLMARSRQTAWEIVKLFQEDSKYKNNVCLIIEAQTPEMSAEIGNLDNSIQQFKNNNCPNIAIVVDMLTTGFDLPNLRKIYLDQVIESPSNLWQKISRVNRCALDKSQGFILDFVGNKETLIQARQKYYGEGKLALTSTLEKISQNLDELKTIWRNIFPVEKQSLSSEEKREIITYLVKWRKEKEFVHLVQQVEELTFPQKNTSPFFQNCQKITEIIDLSKLTGNRNNSPQTANPLTILQSKLALDYTYKNDYYHLYFLLPRLNSYQEKFQKWATSCEIKDIIENINKLVNEYEERDLEKFDPYTFTQKLQEFIRKLEIKYQEIKKKSQRDPDYLLKSDLVNYLNNEFSDFRRIFSDDIFPNNLVDKFRSKFKNNFYCFLHWEVYGEQELERLTDQILFEEYHFVLPSTLEKKQAIRQKIIYLIKGHFYAYY